MILSFHPCFTADQNRLCAGRRPDRSDRDAIQAAKAVILPQGCPQSLYAMARENCPHVFPNYDTRFKYPGKTGQTRLFQRMQIPYPPSAAFNDVARYNRLNKQGELPAGLDFPVVFKFDWGGEGKMIYLIRNRDDLAKQLKKAAQYEKSNQKGFILQTVVPTAGRVLRVVRIGQLNRAYWRIAKKPDQFCVNLASGATIDHEASPHLQKKALMLIEQFCHRTGVNLAGFDLIFNTKAPRATPLLLEINYFFGRKGLGGSYAYLELLTQQLRQWLSELESPDE